jgi:Flp pilus assembly protein TadB
MVEEQKPTESKRKANIMLFIVLGCMLTVVALITTGPLQWFTFAFAIAILLYAVIISKRKTGQ